MMPAAVAERDGRRAPAAAGREPERSGRRRVDAPLAAVVALVAAVAIAARVPGAVQLPLWQDEVASARILLEPTAGGVLEHVRRTESTPPAWYLAAWTGRKAGVPVEDLRFLSVLFGAGLAALVVVYARRLLPLWAAGLAGLLAAVGWQFVAHGRELRAYALLMLVAVGFALALERAARRPTVPRLLLVSGVAALGLLTHYFFLFTLVAAVLWVWTTPVARMRLTAALAVALLPSAAWASSFASQTGDKQVEWLGGTSLPKLAYFYSTLFDSAGPLYARVPTPYGFHELARLGVLVLVLAGAALLARRSPEGRLCALLAVVPVVLAGAVWTALDIFNTRNLLATAPFVTVALAASIAAVPRRLALALAPVAVALAFFGLVNAPNFGPPADRIAAVLVRQGWRSGDGILLFGGFHDFRSPLGWYLPGRPSVHAIAPPPDCPRVHVLAYTDEGWAFLYAHPVPYVRVSSTRITSFRWSGALARAAFRQGAFLLSVARHGPCSPVARTLSKAHSGPG